MRKTIILQLITLMCFWLIFLGLQNQTIYSNSLGLVSNNWQNENGERKLVNKPYEKLTNDSYILCFLVVKWTTISKGKLWNWLRKRAKKRYRNKSFMWGLVCWQMIWENEVSRNTLSEFDWTNITASKKGDGGDFPGIVRVDQNRNGHLGLMHKLVATEHHPFFSHRRER